METSTRIRKWVPFLALAVATVVFFGPFLFSRTYFNLNHHMWLFVPDYIYYKDCLAHGYLPLWDPYRGCGEPFLADIQRGVLYPPNLLHALLPTAIAGSLFIAGHILLAGFSVFLLCRTLRVSESGSLFAGVAFAFSTTMITRIEAHPLVASSALCPLVLMGFARWIDRRVGGITLTAIFLALQILSGYPETVLSTGFAIALLAVCACLSEGWQHHGLRAVCAPLFAAAAVVIIASLLSAAQLIPTFEAVRLSPRSQPRELSLVSEGAVPPLTPLMLLFPSACGTRECPWGAPWTDYWERAFYIGIVPVIALVTAILLRLILVRRSPELGPSDTWRQLRMPFLVILWVFSFLYALGGHTPFFRMVARVMPAVLFFPRPARALFLSTLALCCLAGVALDFIFRSSEQVKSPASSSRLRIATLASPVVFALVSVLVCACWFFPAAIGYPILERVFRADPGSGLPIRDLLLDSLKLIAGGPLFASMIAIARRRSGSRPYIVWACMLGTFLDLFMTGRTLLPKVSADSVEQEPAYLSEVRPEGRIVRYYAQDGPIKVPDLSTVCSSSRDLPLPRGSDAILAKDMMAFHWASAFKVFNLHSSSNFVSSRIEAILDGLSSLSIDPVGICKLFQALNCETLIYVEPTGRPEAPVRVRSVRFPEVLPRAYVVSLVRSTEHEGGLFQAVLRQDGVVLREEALVDPHEWAGGGFEGLTGRQTKYRVEPLLYAPNSLEIHVTTDHEGLLVVSDTHYPGWIGTVNGREVPIHRVNYAFRGIRVPSGASVVKMEYRPQTLRIGILISLATLLGLALSAATAVVRTKRKKSIQGPVVTG